MSTSGKGGGERTSPSLGPLRDHIRGLSPADLRSTALTAHAVLELAILETTRRQGQAAGAALVDECAARQDAIRAAVLAPDRSGPKSP